MAARNPAQAVRELQDWLQAVISCVIRARVVIARDGFAPSLPTSRPRAAFLGDRPVRLPGRARIDLSADYYYRLPPPAPGQPWQVSTAAYRYTLFDEHGREIVAYHWHPGSADQALVPFPHLHVGPGAVEMALLDAAGRSRGHNALRSELQRLHLPTHHATLADLVRLAIEGFDVPPTRADWQAVLARTAPVTLGSGGSG